MNGTLKRLLQWLPVASLLVGFGMTLAQIQEVRVAVGKVQVVADATADTLSVLKTLAAGARDNIRDHETRIRALERGHP